MQKFDVTVIGSGPGGYVAAIRCAQLGFKTALVEKYNSLGGTCLNVGCIPSKALLDSSEHYHNAKVNFKEHGITLENLSYDLGQMVERKNKVVETTTSGIDYLMNKNDITVLHGLGSFEDKNHLIIKGEKGEEKIESDKFIIATGSKPSTLPFIELDGERIITSTEALDLKEVPKHMVVIGGGVIGLELGSVYLRLGAEVTVVEYMDRITPGMDKDVSKELRKVLKKQGMNFHLSSKVSDVSREGDNVLVKYENKKGDSESLNCDYCLVSVGRKPYTNGLGLEKIGLELDERGRVKTDNHLKTNIDNIYAIGDVVKGIMLAHKAEEEGIFVAELLKGEKPHLDYNLIPNVIYTWPEAASVGKTEEELVANKVEYKSGKFPIRALGRARASGDIDGFAKVLSDKTTDEVLGVHIVSARAADMISECVTAMEFRASAEDIARISHAHPTYMEAVKEAALDATGARPIHS